MSRRSYSRAAIVQRLFNTPLQVLPDTASIVLGAIGSRFDVTQLFNAAEGRVVPIGELEARAADTLIDISASTGTDQLAPKVSADRLMHVIEGVAHVQIRGELVAENGIGPASGFTGYDGIRAQVLAADADNGVRGIILDIDSPGGEVAGLYELVGMLMARRGVKPMRAVIRGVGASAACAVAVCADPGQVTIQALGIGGSVGTMSMHADFSGKLEQDGVKVTLITAGSHKAEGNPFEPLPEAVRARIEAMINIANDQFIAHVAVARGLSPEDVRAQQAQVYQGEEAVAAGLADKVMSWADSIDEFVAQVNGGDQSGRSARSAPGARSQETKMGTIETAPAAEAPEFTQASQDAAVSAAVTAERGRVSELAELDAESSISPALASAITDGTSAGQFAIGMAKAAKAQGTTALGEARADAVRGENLPDARTDQSSTTTKPNRGQAAVERMQGRHPGLPGKA